MILFRSTIYFTSLVILTIVIALAISTIGWFVSYETRSKMANIWGKINLWLLKKICGLDYQVTGWENIPEEGCIFLVKHQSAWETIALRGLLPHKQIWVLKRELMWVPFFGWALFLVQAIAIDRKAGRQAVKKIVEEGRNHLDKGRNVVIFPEGTRVAPGQRKRYGIGGAFLAQKTKRPVVPVAHNAGVFWRRRDLKKYPGTIQVVIGPVIDTNDLSTSEINQQVEEWIESTMETLPMSSAQQA